MRNHQQTDIQVLVRFSACSAQFKACFVPRDPDHLLDVTHLASERLSILAHSKQQLQLVGNTLRTIGKVKVPGKVKVRLTAPDGALLGETNVMVANGGVKILGECWELKITGNHPPTAQLSRR